MVLLLLLNFCQLFSLYFSGSFQFRSWQVVSGYDDLVLYRSIHGQRVCRWPTRRVYLPDLAANLAIWPILRMNVHIPLTRKQLIDLRLRETKGSNRGKAVPLSKDRSRIGFPAPPVLFYAKTVF